MDYERELLSRLDEMARHLASVEEELIKFRKERFLKSVGTFLFILLPIIGVGFLVPNFIRKSLPQYLPPSARTTVETLLPVDPADATPTDEPGKPVVKPSQNQKPASSTMGTSSTATSTASSSNNEI